MGQMKSSKHNVSLCGWLLFPICLNLSLSAMAQPTLYPDTQDVGPAAMHGFMPFPFSPPIDSGVYAADGTPLIAEWTRQNRPGDIMALTGEEFSLYGGDEAGRKTEFLIYGKGVETHGLIHR
ncbi:MAG: hypothetical protein OES84_00565, partial [Kiritimatiellaceae bacterium]|nr:hypothetical protein [Kiritimatiellaceae bacterium]